VINLTPTHLELIGFGLFIASELVGMSSLRSNSLLQLALRSLRQAFPYRSGRN
jgi:hypothetical protein